MNAAINQYQTRLDQLNRCLPQLFSPFPWAKSLLYVGASPTRRQFLEELMQVYTVSITEAHEDNCLFLIQKYRDLYDTGRLHCFDIRELSAQPLPVKAFYDIIFWWHGPEHIPMHELKDTLESVEAGCRLVILGMPWGFSPQGPVFGNPYEVHQWQPTPRHFEDLGYNVDTAGPRSTPQDRNFLGNLLAWKFTEEPLDDELPF